MVFQHVGTIPKYPQVWSFIVLGLGLPSGKLT